MINLALLGYGKMGKTLAQLAPQRGFEVSLVMDIDVNDQSRGITREKFKGIDVCVDFTTPQAVVENVHRVAALGVSLVVGTTGWQKHVTEVRKVIEQAGVGMVYAANFSIGVNLFYKLARAAAEIFAPFPMYDPFVTEAHHKMKKDAPSGTAHEISRQIQPYLVDRDIPVASVRAGYIPECMNWGSIPRPTPSSCATPPVAGRDSLKALCTRPAGWSGRRDFTALRKCWSWEREADMQAKLEIPNSNLVGLHDGFKFRISSF